MVGPGDVDPDLLSVAAGLVMGRDPPHTATSPEGDEIENDPVMKASRTTFSNDEQY